MGILRVAIDIFEAVMCSAACGHHPNGTVMRMGGEAGCFVEGRPPPEVILYGRREFRQELVDTHLEDQPHHGVHADERDEVQYSGRMESDASFAYAGGSALIES